MKVLQVLLSPRIGGAEALADSLDSAWSQAEMTCKTHFLDLKGAASPSRYRRWSSLLAEIRVWQPDVIVSHSALPNIYARMAAGNNTPVVTVLHSATDDFMNPSLRWAERLLHCRTTAVVAVSENQARAYVARFGSKVPVQVIPNGIRPEATPKDGYRARPQRASTVARVAAQKNPHLWSEVAAIIGREGPDIDLEWWGPSSVDVEVENVFSAANLAGGKGSYKGATYDPVSVLNSSDLLFHTADREAHSIGILEAAAVGLPVVCSTSVAKSLPAEVVAIPFNDGDPRSAVEALRSVIENWPRVACEALNAAPLIAKKFSIDGCAMTYTALFRSSLQAGAKNGSISNAPKFAMNPLFRLFRRTKA